MSSCVMMSKSISFQLSANNSMKLEEEYNYSPKAALMGEKQGIVSILGSDPEANKSGSLRRTLSADMSSKKWLAQNGFHFSPMKKIASSEELAANHSSSSSSSSSSEAEVLEYDQGDSKEEFKRPGQDEVWRSIQSQKNKPDSRWTWGSILFEKNEQSSKLPPPYIPPLVRRSGSSLSEKSLEICTESLGSETGSDGFSSYPASEAGDAEEEKESDPHQRPELLLQPSYEDFRVAKYSHSHYGKKSGPRSFPPPLPSLAREDGASVHMQSRRQNGRLVLEAVSVPSQNYFQARREHGRLRLSLVNDPTSIDARDEEEIAEFDQQVFDDFEEIDQENDEDEEEEEEGYNSDWKFEMADENQTNLRGGGGLVPAHKPTTIMVKKLLGLDKKNLAWSSRFNRPVNLVEVEDEEVVVGDDTNNPPPLLPQSLPPPPPPCLARLISNSQPSTVAGAAASFNAYEYFWREKKPTMASIIDIKSTTDHHDQSSPPSLKKNINQSKQVILAGNLKGYEQQNLVLMRGNKADYLVPLLRRCNESRRSLLLFEPYCIAT